MKLTYSIQLVGCDGTGILFTHNNVALKTRLEMHGTLDCFEWYMCGFDNTHAKDSGYFGFSIWFFEVLNLQITWILIHS